MSFGRATTKRSARAHKQTQAPRGTFTAGAHKEISVLAQVWKSVLPVALLLFKVGSSQ